MRAEKPVTQSPWLFFWVVGILSIPFYFVFTLSLFPRDIYYFPIGTFMVFVPFAAASALTYREGGRTAVLALWRRAFDFRKISPKIWYLAIFLLLPAAHYLAYLLSNLLGAQLPAPTPPWATPGPFVIQFAVLFVFAVAEEIGWTGYATDPLQRTVGTLLAAVLIAVIWQVWHWPAHILLGRSTEWIIWHSLVGIMVRILMIWVYNNTAASVFACEVMHATVNVAYRIFPTNGTQYDPITTSLVLTVLVVIAIAIWGPKTLAGRGLASAPSG